MKVAFATLLIFGLVSQLQAGLWLKRWGDYGKRIGSIGLNAATLGLQADIVVNARNGDFMILPSNYKELKDSVNALLTQNTYQEAMETKVEAKEKILKIVLMVQLHPEYFMSPL